MGTHEPLEIACRILYVCAVFHNFHQILKGSASQSMVPGPAA